MRTYRRGVGFNVATVWRLQCFLTAVIRTRSFMFKSSNKLFDKNFFNFYKHNDSIPVLKYCNRYCNRNLLTIIPICICDMCTPRKMIRHFFLFFICNLIIWKFSMCFKLPNAIFRITKSKLFSISCDFEIFAIEDDNAESLKNRVFKSRKDVILLTDVKSGWGNGKIGGNI